MPHNLPLEIGNYKYRAGPPPKSKYRKEMAVELEQMTEEWNPLQYLDDETMTEGEQLERIYLRFFRFSEVFMILRRLGIESKHTFFSYTKKDKRLLHAFNRWQVLRNATWGLLAPFHNTNPMLYAFLCKNFGMTPDMSFFNDNRDSQLELLAQGLDRSAKRIELQMKNGNGEILDLEPENGNNNHKEREETES